MAFFPDGDVRVYLTPDEKAVPKSLVLLDSAPGFASATDAMSWIEQNSDANKVGMNLVVVKIQRRCAIKAVKVAPVPAPRVTKQPPSA